MQASIALLMLELLRSFDFGSYTNDCFEFIRFAFTCEAIDAAKDSAFIFFRRLILFNPTRFGGRNDCPFINLKTVLVVSGSAADLLIDACAIVVVVAGIIGAL